MADNGAPSPELLRKDMQAVLSYIQGGRIVSMARETAISRLKGWLIGRFWAGMASALLALLLAWLIWPDAGGHAALVSALVLIMLASRMGAITSIGRRMNDDNLGIGVGDDSIFTLASLGSGRNGLALALLSSNVFGLVVFALFASGVPSSLGIVGGIAPTFRDVALTPLREKTEADAMLVTSRRKDEVAACAVPIAKASAPLTPAKTGPADPAANSSAPAPQGPAAAAPPANAAAPGVACAAAALVRKEAEDIANQSAAALAAARQTTAADGSSADKWFGALANALGLLTVPDLFKMLIWAFIAGFAEQLVPDMLDSIATRARAAQDKQGTAPAK
jgi:hypothetical protein